MVMTMFRAVRLMENKKMESDSKKVYEMVAMDQVVWIEVTLESIKARIAARWMTESTAQRQQIK